MFTCLCYYFLTCPKKFPKFLHLHHQGRCFSYSVSLNLAWKEKHWGKPSNELSTIQQEMIYKEPLIFFDANHVVDFANLLKILRSKASVQSLEFVAIMRFQWRKKSRPKRWKRPTTPTNQHQPPNHHILGLKQQLTTSVTTGLATHLCDQLVTAVKGCHRRNYLGLGKSDRCINQQLEIR